MKLEVGKYYRNKSNGVYMSVVGKVVTTMWENVLVGESPHAPDALIPLDGEMDTEDWVEVKEEEWLRQFADTSPQEQESPQDE